MSRSRLAGEGRGARQGREWQYHIELPGPAPHVQGARVGQKRAVRLELGVLDRRGRVERDVTPGVRITEDQKVQTDRGVGVRPRLEVRASAVVAASATTTSAAPTPSRDTKPPVVDLLDPTPPQVRRASEWTLTGP